MEAKCKTHRFLEVVLLVLWISGCAAESPDYTDPVEIGTKSVTLPSKHSLLDAVADRIFDGEKAGDYYSAWVRARGDLNGDDYADIVIGAPNHNNFRGRVYIYFGGKDVSSVADLILTGETPDAR
ncbi:MAG: integrin alpha, partial [Candidatus Hermodarchaeia archaeon]